MILSIDDKVVFVMRIVGGERVNGGGRLVLRCTGDQVSASIEAEGGHRQEP